MSDELIKLSDAKIGLKVVANSLSGALAADAPNEVKVSARQWLKEATKVFEDLEDALNEQLKTRVLADGTEASENGSKEIQLDDCTVQAVIKNAGYDTAKTYSMLLSKGLDPNVYMNKEIKYKPDNKKLAILASGGRIGSEDLEDCKAVKDYRLVVKARKAP